MTADTSHCTVRHLDHVGIAVTDVEAAVALFRRLLDAPETPIIEAPHIGLRAALVAYGQTRLELLESTDPQNGIGKFVAARGEGLHHIAFAVDDIHAKMAELKEAGVPLIDQEPRQGLTGAIAFLRPEATRHVLVELVQPQGATHEAPIPGAGHSQEAG